jgi:hypothetical protein
MAGMYSAHCTGTPITRLRATTTTRAPSRAAARAADDPAGPPAARTSQLIECFTASVAARSGVMAQFRLANSPCFFQMLKAPNTLFSNDATPHLS